MPRLKPEPKEQLLMPVLMEMQHQGDGSYKLKPVTPDMTLDTWISATKVRSIVGGKISLTTIYRLGEAQVIKARKPTPDKWEFSLKSTMEYKQGIEGDALEFWAKRDMSPKPFEKVVAKPLHRA